jgi:hypothetical protein
MSCVDSLCRLPTQKSFAFCSKRGWISRPIPGREHVMDVPTWRWHGHFQVATGRMPGFAGILEKCGLRKDRGRYRDTDTDTTRGCRLSAEERLYPGTGARSCNHFDGNWLVQDRIAYSIFETCIGIGALQLNIFYCSSQPRCCCATCMPLWARGESCY